MNQLNNTTEHAVIGCLIQDPLSWGAASKLVPSDFTLKNLRQLFKTSKEIYDRGDQLDQSTLFQELRGRVEFDPWDVLNECLAASPAPSGITYHAETLQRLSAARAVTAEISSANARIISEPRSVDIVSSDLVSRVSDIARGIGTNHDRTWHASDGVMSIHDEIIAGRRTEEAISTTWPGVDAVTSGGLWQEMLIIGARPGMGKTSFALALAQNVAKSFNVLFVSLEESKKSLQHRLLSSLSSVRLSDIRQRRVMPGERSEISVAAGKIKGLNLWIHHQPGMSAVEIDTLTRRFRLDRKLDLLIVDHLDRVAKNKREVLDSMAYNSQKLADVIGLGGFAGIVLHQLTKECEKRDDKRPQLGDLRYVGEADARAVWFLYRDHVYRPDTASPFDAELLISKNNNGALGSVKMHCDLARMQWGPVCGTHCTETYRVEDY